MNQEHGLTALWAISENRQVASLYRNQQLGLRQKSSGIHGFILSVMERTYTDLQKEVTKRLHIFLKPAATLQTGRSPLEGPLFVEENMNAQAQ